MAHFAKLDDNNTVLTTIVVSDEDAPTEAQGQVFLENIFGWAANKWKKTSYNTYEGIYYQADRITPSVDQSKALRANFAGAGMIYNEEHDIFHVPQPYSSWTLNTTSGRWVPPVPKPDPTDTIFVYAWDENTQSWIENNDGRFD